MRMYSLSSVFSKAWVTSLSTERKEGESFICLSQLKMRICKVDAVSHAVEIVAWRMGTEVGEFLGTLSTFRGVSGCCYEQGSRYQIPACLQLLCDLTQATFLGLSFLSGGKKRIKKTMAFASLVVMTAKSADAYRALCSMWHTQALQSEY